MKNQLQKNLRGHSRFKQRGYFSSWPNKLILYGILILAFGFNQNAFSQVGCCPSNTLNISTGYNPATGGTITPTTTDPKWTVCTGGPFFNSTAWTDLAYDLHFFDGFTVSNYAGQLPPAWVVPTHAGFVTPCAGSAWLSCFNGNAFATHPKAAYNVQFCRSFSLCQAACVTFNLQIAGSQWVKSITVDGVATNYMLPAQSPLSNNWSTYENVTPFTVCLSSGPHIISIILVPSDVPGTQTLGLNVCGTISTPTNVIQSEKTGCTAAACSNPVITPGSVCSGGGTTTLPLTGLTGGTWMSSNPAWASVNASTGLITGQPAGCGHSVNITYTDPCGRASAPVVLTIKCGPTLAPTVTYPSGQCGPSSIALHANLPAGVSTMSWGPTVGVPPLSSYSTPNPIATTTGWTSSCVNNYIYSLTAVSSTTGCSTTAPVTATIYYQPVCNIHASNGVTSISAGGTLHICAGATLTLSDAGGGPTGCLSYSWSSPGLVSSTTSTTVIGSVSAAPGSYLITFTKTNPYDPACKCSQTLTVVIDNTPNITIAPVTAVCAGTSLFFSATIPGGATMHWLNPTLAGSWTSIAGSTTNPLTLPTSSANAPACSNTYIYRGYYTYLSSGLTCTSNIANAPATIYYVPKSKIMATDITTGTSVTTPGNMKVCQGDQIKMDNAVANLAGCVSYSWSSSPAGFIPAGFLSSAPPFTFTVTAAPGTYTLTLTTSNPLHPACSTTSSLTITVNPQPAPPSVQGDTVCVGSPLNFNVSPIIGGLTYNWSGQYWLSTGCNNIPPVSTVGPSISLPGNPCASGTYCVTATNQFGCKSTPTCVNGLVVNPCATLSAATCVAPGSPVVITVTVLYPGTTVNYYYISGGVTTTGSITVSGTSSTFTLTMPATGSLTVAVTYTTYAIGPNQICIGQCPSTITINPIPDPPVVDSMFACQNGCLTLYASGVPTSASSSSPATVIWTGPCIAGSVTGNPYTICPASTACTGTYCATVTVAGCTSNPGCGYAYVEPTPWATLSGPTGCQTPGTYNYTITFSPAGSIVYYSIDGVIYTIPSGATSPYTVPVTLGSTTPEVISLLGIYNILTYNNPQMVICDSVLTASDTITPIPPAPGVDSMFACNNDCLTLYATGVPAGATVTWTGPCIAGSVTGNPYVLCPVTTACTGTYCATYTVGGCTSAAGCGYAYVEPTPWATLSGPSGCIPPGTYPYTITFSPSPSTIIYSVGGTIYTVPGAVSPYTFNVTLGASPVTVDLLYIYNILYYDATKQIICDSLIMDSLTILPSLPAPVVDTMYACNNDCLTLFASGVPAGATITWTGPCIAGSVTGNPYVLCPVTTACTGVYCATATMGGCTSPVGCGQAIVEPTPWATLSGPTGCQPPGTYNYTITFSPPGSVVTYNVDGIYYTTPIGATSPYIVPVTLGTSSSEIISLVDIYSIWSYSPQIVCDSFLTASDTITTTPGTPDVPSQILCNGSCLTLNATGVPAGATVTWTGPCIAGSATGNPYTICPVSTACTGSYCATVTVGGCSSAPGCGTVTVEPTPSATLSGPSGCVVPGTYSYTITFAPSPSSITYSVHGVVHTIPFATSPLTIPVAIGSTPVTVKLISISHTWSVSPGVKCDSLINDSLTIYPEVCPSIVSYIVTPHNGAFGSSPCTFDATATIFPSVHPCYTASYTWVMTNGGVVIWTSTTSGPSITGIPFVATGYGTLAVYASFTGVLGDICNSSVMDTIGCIQGNAFAYKPPRNNNETNTSVGEVSNTPTDIRLVPNPNSGTFRIVGTLASSNNLNKTTVEIVNSVGQAIYTDEATLEDGKIDKKVTLDGNLADGMYLLRLKGENGYQVIRFVLEH